MIFESEAGAKLNFGLKCGHQLHRALARRDPERLYRALNKLTGATQDPCVLYTFRCAVYFARTAHPKAELLKWWNWKGRTLACPKRLLPARP